MNKKVKTRFAPSPTGMLHVGGLRTALYAYLYAKKLGGIFTLRIEDTDRNRLVEGAIEQIVYSLNWGGIEIQEGVDVDTETGTVIQKGDKGPYIQSERKEIYRKYVDMLLESGHAYYAFDTSEELDAMRERQTLNKQATRYERENMTNSLTLSKEETEKKITDGVPYVVRLKVDHEGKTTYTDVVRGEITVNNSQIDDQVLLKADGYPTYHLAVVVDDHLMEFTHVIRGDEWLPSTPKHVLLYEAFGWKKPQFVHLALLVNEKKQKLSKRHGDVSVGDFEKKGYLPEALVNFIALLGWNPGTDQEVFSMDELVDSFSLENIVKSPSFFDLEKLDWFNKQYLSSMDPQELAKRAKPFFDEAGMELSVEEIAKVIPLEQTRVTTLAEFPVALKFMFAENLEYEPELLVWKKSTAEESKQKLVELKAFIESIQEWNLESIDAAIRSWIKEKEYGAGDVLWPMRTALSGQKHSPSPFEIAAALGREKTLDRLGKAVEVL